MINIKDFKPDNILLLWLGKIGDFVVSTPFIKSVRKKYPDAKISVMVRPPVDKLAVIAEGIDDVIVFPKGAKSFKQFHVFAGKLLFTKWDMCIDLNPSYSGSSGRVTLLSGAKYKIGFANPKAVKYYNCPVDQAGNEEHMMHRYDRLAELLGLEHDYKMHLSVKENDLEKADKILSELGIKGDFILYHPGNFKKDYSCWDKDKFIQLTKDIKANYPEYHHVYLAGPGEEDEVAEMISRLSGIAIQAPSMGLTVTAAFLSRASVSVVNSTGTLHMSEAVGTPTLSFHKTYSYLCWRPLDTLGEALDSGDWNSVKPVSYDAAWDAFQKIKSRLG